MRQIVAVDGQSVFDIALLYCGDATMAWHIARANAIAITAIFETNTLLLIPDAEIISLISFVENDNKKNSAPENKYRKIVALPGQSIFDIALLYCGDATIAWSVAVLNNIPITTTIESKSELQVPIDRNNIARIYEDEGTVFATGIIESTPLDVPWLLATGFWNDAAYWNDAAIWND